LTLAPPRIRRYDLSRSHPGEITIDTENIVRAVAEAAIEMKATELTIIDVRGRTSFTDWFVLCNGSNSRQLKAIAEHIVQTSKNVSGLQPMGVEGGGTSKWVLIDLSDVIIHVFHQDMRGHYDLDGLWIDAPRVAPEDLGIEDVPAAAVGYALP
jgi:ribosome silencing factor RsfS/YbeB/iojap